MWHLTKRTVEKGLESLLHIHDTPKRTAAAVGVGVGIGFSPFIGLHTGIGLAVAFLFNLNRVAVIAGSWINLPWTMAPYYAATTALGAWLTGAQMPPDFLGQLEAIRHLPGWNERMSALFGLLRPLLHAYILGSMICAVPIGLLAYRGALAFILARKKR